MPVAFGLTSIDIKLSGCDSAAFGALQTEACPGAEGFESRLQMNEIDTGVKKSADNHVAANSGERVDVADFHGNRQARAVFRIIPDRK
jgi:hypothetical protein